LLSSFFDATGISVALVDNFSGKILFDQPKSGLCRKFHHNHPEASKKCLKVNLLSLENVSDNLEPKIVRCANGCIESLIPIVFNNAPIATIFAGIMDFRDPYLDFFRNNAKEYGFDEHDYLEEVRKIPVIDRDYFIKHIEILNKFSIFITPFIYQHQALIETEQALKKEEKFFNDMLNAIRDGISVIDRDFNIIKTNMTLENIYPDKMPFAGKKCFEVYQNRSTPCKMCPVKMSILTKTKRHAIKSSINAEGAILWIDVHSYPILDEHKEAKAPIEIIRDITQQKKNRGFIEGREKAFSKWPCGCV
jgi:PAS domain S-box-containing protein